MFNQPFQSNINVDLIFTRNRVTTNFSALNFIQFAVLFLKVKNQSKRKKDFKKKKKKKKKKKSKKKKNYKISIISVTPIASFRSFLFPKTKRGIPASGGLVNKSNNSFFDCSNFSLSDASTTYTIALTPLQYLSHCQNLLKKKKFC